MRAVTVHQPWATLIAIGAKTIETRSWATRYRGPLAIHAAAYGRSVTRWGADGTRTTLGGYTIQRYGPTLYMTGDRHPGPTALPLGAVVATCELVDVVPIHEQFCGHAGEVAGQAVAIVHWPVDYLTPALALIDPNGSGVSDKPVKVTDAIGDYPFGDYRCGRYAWLLGDVRPLDPPAPAAGRQRLWTWQRETATK